MQQMPSSHLSSAGFCTVQIHNVERTFSASLKYAQVRAAMALARNPQQQGGGEHDNIACAAVDSIEMQNAFEGIVTADVRIHSHRRQRAMVALVERALGAVTAGAVVSGPLREFLSMAAALVRWDDALAASPSANRMDYGVAQLIDSVPDAVLRDAAAAGGLGPEVAALFASVLTHQDRVLAWKEVRDAVSDAFEYALHLSRTTADAAEPPGLHALRARISPSALERRRRIARVEALLGRRLPKAVLRGRPLVLSVDMGRPYSQADHVRYLLEEDRIEGIAREKLQVWACTEASACDLRFQDGARCIDSMRIPFSQTRTHHCSDAAILPHLYTGANQIGPCVVTPHPRYLSHS